MISHTKRFNNTGNIPFRCILKITPFLFLLFFLYPGLFEGGEAAAQEVSRPRANAQDETGQLNADFLFRKPIGFLGFRVGSFFPRAGSDLFDMVTRELTLEKSDFRAWDLGIDGGLSLYDRIDLVFSLDSSNRTINSEFRRYVDEQGLPITQTTTFSQTLLTAGLKLLFMERGRSVGRYAWLPSPIVPFVDGGGGLLWYRFKQNGYFVDSTTLEIFPATLESSDWTPTGYLGAGVDIHLLRSTYLTFDLRYSFANHDLERDFEGFEPIDLSGLRITAGVHWHF